MALAETQAEENKQRVLILQSELQALYEQAGEGTDEKAEQQLSQGDLESDGMEATDDERIPLGDSDGFLTVLSRNGRKKQRREAAQDGQGERVQEEVLRPPPPPPASSDVLEWVDHGVLCRHVLDGVPADQFGGALQIWLPICFKSLRERPHERGILDEAAERAIVEPFVQQG